MTTLYEDPALGFGNEGDLSQMPSAGIEPSGIGMASDPLRAAVDQAGGIGVAAPTAQPSVRDSMYASMSPGQEFGARLAEFGAGVSGAPSPMQSRMEAKRRDKLAQMEELKGAVTALEHGSTIAAGMAEGDEKNRFLESYAGRLDGISPGLGETFKAVAAKPGFAEQMAKYAEKSPTIRRAIEIDPTGKTAFNLLKSPDAQHTISKEIDASVMPTILRKGQTFLMGWQQLVPKEMADKFNEDGRLSASEFIRANEWLKENKPDIAKTLAYSDEELGTIHRNSDAVWHTLGIVSPKDEGEVIKAQAKGENRNPVTRMQPKMMGGKRMEQQQEWRNGQWENVGDLVPHFKPDEGGAAAVPPELADLHGDDYLKKLPSSEGALVKAIAEGRISPTTLSTRGGHREQVLQKVAQYDPAFDATNYNARAGVRKDFTSGTASRNVTAINTAIGHLGTMQELGDKLGNKDIRAWNQVANALGVQLGAEEATDFSVVQGAVADELMRVFRVVGASEKESEAWGKRFNAAGSPRQINGAIQTAADLLGSRIESLDDQWKRGMGTDKGYDKLLSDKSKATFQKLGGRLERYGISAEKSGGAAPAATNAKGWKLMKDASGNQAYVSPDGAQFEEVK